jgi:hypothetical protein
VKAWAVCSSSPENIFSFSLLYLLFLVFDLDLDLDLDFDFDLDLDPDFFVLVDFYFLGVITS